MEEKETTPYPRFISNKPCGIDKFEGKSQERLTNAIANHIVYTDQGNDAQNLSKIIGLEGGWGVGKSNVIKQLSKHPKIKDSYFVFEYDAWGHQEDLQRRSFLETFTSVLVKEKILTGETEIRKKNGQTKKVSWPEKLEYLLSRKTKTISDKRPKLSSGIVAFIIVAIFTPIAISISGRIKTNWVAILLPFIPFLLAAGILWCVLKKKGKSYKDIFNEVLSIYTGKIENEETYETISEDEPTVTEFKNWMKDISDQTTKKIIIVYDNMDRLPAEKLKELWSSIHTFFSEDGFEKIWALIPFDEENLAHAFEGSNNGNLQTKYFIRKTFPVVYSVRPLVITDFTKIFDILFEEAFGKAETKNQSYINRSFRLEKPKATMREIIEYINQLVALKNIWKEEIDLLYIAIFRLKKDELLEEPVTQILSGEYLGKYLPNIVTNDEKLQKNISALTYGLSIEDAEQIPMSKYIDRCFNLENGSDINNYSTSKNFFLILTHKIDDSDPALLDNIVNCLSNLNTSAFREEIQKNIISLWNKLAIKELKTPLHKQEFNGSYQILLKNSDDEHKKRLVQNLCKRIQYFKEFNSQDYFNALSALDNYLKEKNIGIKVTDELIEIKKEPELFVAYVLCAKDKFKEYKLGTEPEKLTEYLTSCVPDNCTVLPALKYLVGNPDFQFDPLKKKIEETLQSQVSLTENNFKPLLDAYKILSGGKPLKVQLNQTQRQNLWNSLVSKPDKPEFIEIVAMQIANGAAIGNIQLNGDEIRLASENIDYYANYGELLVKNLSWNLPVLTQILKYMTENKLGYNLTLETVLPKFFEMKNNINVPEQTMLEQLNRWEKNKNSINTANIQAILPDARFFQFSKATKNPLTDHLNRTIIDKLSTIPHTQLLSDLKQPANYWSIVINNFIATEFLSPLSDNLTNLGIQYLDEIAASRMPVPNNNDIVYKIIDKLDTRETKETITDIKNKICNNKEGYQMDANKFIFLREWLEEQGDLASRPGDVTQYILKPVITDEGCLKKIVEKADFYAGIINAGGEQSNSFKDIIKNKIQNTTDAALISFAMKIGVEKASQKE